MARFLPYLMHYMLRFFCVFCLLGFLLGSLSLDAQTNVNFDSLQTVIDRYPTEDTVKARMLINFANDIRKTDQIRGLAAAEQAIALAERLHQPLLVARAYVAKGNNLFNQRHPIEGIAIIQQALQIFEVQKSDFWAATTALRIGDLSSAISQYDTAKEFCQKAEKSFKKLGSQSNLAKCYNCLAVATIQLGENEDALTYLNMSHGINLSINNAQGLIGDYNNYGFLYANLANFTKALEYYHKSLTLNEKTGSKADLAHVYSNISGVFFRLNDISKSLEYDSKALEIYQENNMEMQVGACYVNMATKYKEMRNYDKALEYNLTGKSILEPLGAQQFLAICISNIGATYIDMKDFVKAYPYQIEALQMFEAMKNDAEIARIKYNLAAIIFGASDDDLQHLGIQHENRKALSESYAVDCIKIGEESGSVIYVQKGHKILSQIYENNGDYINALKAFQHFIVLRDSTSGECSENCVNQIF